ncbi:MULTISPECIES: SMC-Scp complex subunit ScpB [Gracilibacillus]|uniref:SMC-Scp complex subunit ScpB n=1 Tax=Gracilibacillus TaxID=74385 RepID=UPI0008253EA0|nr:MULTISPECIES: SMC-Scp complex subunit ScpB [Gracilibacillus]
MDIHEMKAVMEGLIFAAGDEGIRKNELRKVLDLDKDMAEHMLNELKFEYEHSIRGIMLMESQNMLFLTTKPEHSEYYSKFKETKVHTKLSQAALETLAIIAYLQPITRTEIEEIRGVKSERPLQTLISRALIEEVGRKEGIGRPILFGTTIDFLTYFGLSSIDDLPPLPDNFDEVDIEQEADLFFDQLKDMEN